MLQKLTYTNSLGVELSINRSAPFLIQSFDTTENVNIYNAKGVLQDGSTYLGNSLDIRDVSIGLILLSNTKEQLITLRKQVTQIFNPKLGEGYLTYTDEAKSIKIKCIPAKIPYFENNEDAPWQSALVNLTCNNPFWQDLTQIKAEIALWIGEFEFPLELVAGGIEMGYRQPSLIVNTFNPGDVPCGLTAQFTALATLTNPSILNVNTGEYIKALKTMVAGEILNISTGFGNKKVTSTLNGVVTNAFNCIDLGSTFLQLASGDNLFRYDALSGISNLIVAIYYTPQYLNV
jgi:hypothetical protein